MRHRVAHRKLGRVTEHRISMLRNLATALIRHEHVTTTVARAKEMRPFVERLITVAKRGTVEGATPVHTLTARRLVMQDLQDREVVKKLFDSIAPRFASRPGGYTRILRLGHRKGDGSEVAQIELVGSEYDPKAGATEGGEGQAEAPKATGVGGRLRAAAARLRGKKAEPAGEEAAAKKPAKPRARKKKTEGPEE